MVHACVRAFPCACPCQGQMSVSGGSSLCILLVSVLFTCIRLHGQEGGRHIPWSQVPPSPSPCGLKGWNSVWQQAPSISQALNLICEAVSHRGESLLFSLGWLISDTLALGSASLSLPAPVTEMHTAVPGSAPLQPQLQSCTPLCLALPCAGTGEPDGAPHTCAASPLPSEPSPALPFLFVTSGINH